MLTSATTITFVRANLVSILLEAINVPVVQVTWQQNKKKNAKVGGKVWVYIYHVIEVHFLHVCKTLQKVLT